jgi:predicted nucleic acid-binding Zn ribbon protein
MPTYDYLCADNGAKVEVFHKIDELLTSWGELCERAHIEPGDTPLEAPVRKLISSAAVVHSSALSNAEPACAAGGCCAAGRCGYSTD